jgi:hypothetical protein
VCVVETKDDEHCVGTEDAMMRHNVDGGRKSKRQRRERKRLIVVRLNPDRIPADKIHRRFGVRRRHDIEVEIREIDSRSDLNSTRSD